MVDIHRLCVVEFKLYVGMLSRSTTEADVRAMFTQFGNIQEIYIMRDSESRPKGSAFVKFTQAHEANAAILGLDGKIRDKDAPGNIQVRFAQTAKDKLRNQPQLQQQQQLLALQYQQMMYGMMPGFMGQQPMGQQPMGAYGQPPASTQPAVPGTAKYQDPNAYQPPYAQALNPYMAGAFGQQVAPMGYGAMGTERKQAPKQQYGPDGANLFVYNVPEAYTDADMNSLFSNFGTVVSANVQKDLTTGRSKGYGFVSYDNATAAAAAIKQLDGFVIGSKKLSVRIKGQRQGRPY
jgi:RNA recognition motif-containing protein